MTKEQELLICNPIEVKVTDCISFQITYNQEEQKYQVLDTTSDYNIFIIEYIDRKKNEHLYYSSIDEAKEYIKDIIKKQFKQIKNFLKDEGK